VIVLNDAHLRRRDYISYHADRIHDSLEKDTPAMRPVRRRQNLSSWHGSVSDAAGGPKLALFLTRCPGLFNSSNFPVILRFQVQESQAIDLWRGERIFFLKTNTSHRLRLERFDSFDGEHKRECGGQPEESLNFLGEWTRSSRISTRSDFCTHSFGEGHGLFDAEQPTRWLLSIA